MSGEDALLAAFVACFVASGWGLHRLARAPLRSRGSGAASALLGVGVVVGAFLSGGEIYYRFVYDATDSFGLTKTHRRWIERHWRTNDAGVRDDLDYFDFIAPDKTRRITFLGDSFTAGHGLDAIDDRFANLVRAARPDWEVHVIAHNGDDTRRQLDTLAAMMKIPSGGGPDLKLTLDPSGRIVVGEDGAGRRVLGRERSGEVVLREPGGIVRLPDPDHRLYRGYQFDTVVWVYVLNDIVDIVPEWGKILDRIYRDSEPGWVGRESYLLNQWHYRLFALRDPDISRYDRLTADAYREDSPVWQEQMRRMLLLRTLVETGGGRLLVVTFPYLDRLGDDREHRAAHRLLDGFWASAGVGHLDLLSSFEESGPGGFTVSRHDPHPNERAHRLAAEAILRFVEANPG